MISNWISKSDVLYNWLNLYQIVINSCCNNSLHISWGNISYSPAEVSTWQVFSSHNWAGGKYFFFCILDVGQTWIMFLSLSQILWLCLTIFHPCIPARKHFGDCLLIVWKSQNWLNCAYINDLETSFGDQLMQLQFPAYLMKATFIIILVKSLHGRQL